MSLRTNGAGSRFENRSYTYAEPAPRSAPRRAIKPKSRFENRSYGFAEPTRRSAPRRAIKPKSRFENRSYRSAKACSRSAPRRAIKPLPRFENSSYNPGSSIHTESHKGYSPIFSTIPARSGFATMYLATVSRSSSRRIARSMYPFCQIGPRQG